MTESPEAPLHGELRDELVRAMQRVPELAGRELTLTALSGGITNRNFLVTVAGGRDRYVIRLAGNDTHLLGISREVEHAATVAAAGVGVGPGGHRVHPPRGLSRDPLHRGLARVGRGGPPAETIERVAISLRRIHDGPAIPGLFVPLRIVEAYRALAAGARRPDPAPSTTWRRDRPADRARLPGQPDRAPAMPQRPAERQLHRRRRADPDRRLGVRRHGRSVLRPRQLLDQPRAHARRGCRHCWRPTTAGPRRERPARLARLTLMRVVSDFREAMWGVLQQGISTLDVDFVAYAGDHFDRLLAEAATPRFEHALRDAAG